VKCSLTMTFRYIGEDVDRQWEQHQIEKNDVGEKLTWESYRQLIYGFLEEENHQESDEEVISYK